MASNDYLWQKQELRDTPGYTDYVVGVNRNVNGIITSAELKRYYSNIDAEIYFNGEWIEDIAEIDWTYHQSTLPLYGYNSYVFDDVAQGNRIISGSFAINFTKPSKVNEAIKVNNTEVDTSANPSSYEDVEQFLINNSPTISKNTLETVKNDQHYHIWGNKFDIDIVSGEFENYSGQPVHIILTDCYLTDSPRQMRNKDGGNVIEVYRFIARDFKFLE